MSKLDSGRIDSLDSLRGLAALIVLFHHCYYMLDSSKAGWLSIVRLSPLRLFVAGHAAVILFFLLSGFVLALPYTSKQPDAFGFIIRRTCRIYIPFASAVLLSIALVALIPHVHSIPGAAEWLNPPRLDQLTLSLIAGHLLMLGRFQDITLDPPIWSLVHEFRISLIFPLLLWYCRRWPAGTLLATLALAAIAAVGLLATGDADQGVVTASNTAGGSFLVTLRYLPLFAIGAYMAMEARISEFSRGTSLALKSSFVLAGVILLSGPSVPAWSDILLAVGAVLLILAFMSGWQPIFLRAGASRWLGRVSFSLYLVHVPVITAACFLLGGIIPLGAAILVGAISSLLTAQLAYASVELNAHRLGKYLQGAMATPGNNQVTTTSHHEVPQISTAVFEEGDAAELQEKSLMQNW
ncbi:MAG TPA: acyltransferase [Bradyrhizobium sp.]|nr:acyltransferase [Bradyrhizobium sp.]